MKATKKPYYKFCLVPECKNTIRRTPGKVFFCVPKDVNIRKQWCTAMRRSEKISSKSSLYCCEDHFNEAPETASVLTVKYEPEDEDIKDAAETSSVLTVKYEPEDEDIKDPLGLGYPFPSGPDIGSEELGGVLETQLTNPAIVLNLRQQLQLMKNQLQQRDKIIENQNKVIEAKNGKIKSLQVTVKERDETIKERDETIKSLEEANNCIKEKNRMLKQVLTKIRKKCTVETSEEASMKVS